MEKKGRARGREGAREGSEERRRRRETRKGDRQGHCTGHRDHGGERETRETGKKREGKTLASGVEASEVCAHPDCRISRDVIPLTTAQTPFLLTLPFSPLILSSPLLLLSLFLSSVSSPFCPRSFFYSFCLISLISLARPSVTHLSTDLLQISFTEICTLH